MNREIVLDTETTGLSFAAGHKIIEIGCVEIVNGSLTGNTFHHYINPGREVSEDAVQVHGLTSEFLSSYPLFESVAAPFKDFLQDSPLIIHNARFDMGFLNGELTAIQHGQLSNPVLDTLRVARQKFPGAPASLDALCRRFNIDAQHRTFHGALLDAQLLAQVYFHLTRPSLLNPQDASVVQSLPPRRVRAPRSFPMDVKEYQDYKAMKESLIKMAKSS
jgi:DNA polymerase-3 subunit epsilon